MMRPTRSGKGEFVRCSRNSAAVAVLLFGLSAVACRERSSSEAVRLESRMREGIRVLTAVPSAGFRINARVPPALELGSGQIIRLAGGRVLPDSSYFVEPPWAAWPAGVRLRGVLRVSFCRETEALCRSTAIPVDLRD
jgi:hypothetical protein